jgi:membrane associated rhomboid family serine protease
MTKITIAGACILLAIAWISDSVSAVRYGTVLRVAIASGVLSLILFLFLLKQAKGRWLFSLGALGAAWPLIDAIARLFFQMRITDIFR